MFRLPDGTLRFSPRDLIAYLEGDFSAWCDRMDAERVRADPAVVPAPGWFRADPKDAELDLVARKGLEHESRFLARVKAGEPGLVELAQGDSATDTLAAMRAGAPVIFQGHLAVGAWHGYPDFLFRTPGPSALGDYHYVAWDTKLARSARPYFLVQLCAYADLLETIQRVRPAELVFVLGNEDELHFETVHYFAYYRQIRRSFLEFQKTWSPDCIPHPGFDRSWGRWSDAAEQRLDETDHLSRVARISRAQIRRLEEVGIATLRHLAETDVAGVPSIKAPIFDRLRLQARLQYRSTEGAPPLWELVPPPPNEPRRGLVLLPPPSALDVFFDMEGFPFARDGGLEYLFGASVPQGETPAFRDWWAHDDAGEQRAFEGFIDWVMERRKRDPDLHVYHYASYEVTAVKRLAGKYATREAEVDDLLRGDVFVDLYAVVRQGVAIGTRSYSLKAIERLYLDARTGDVVSATGSVVEYQRWMDSGESGLWQESPILRAIRDYNELDCVSTRELRDWLLARQREAGIAYAPDPNEKPAEENEDGPDPVDEVAARLVERGRAREADEAEGSRGSESEVDDGEAARLDKLVGWLAEYHRREEKPMWWRMFTRHEAPWEDLQRDTDCLANLTRTAKPSCKEKRSWLYEYRFDPEEETKLHVGSKCFLAGHHDLSCEIFSIDQDAGLIELKSTASLPDALCLIPDEFVSAAAIKKAIGRYAAAWEQGQVLSQAVDDLLRRRPPRLQGRAGGDLIQGKGKFLDEVVELALALDTTTLCIQGPPGTGKTFTAAAIIAELMRRGKRVGVTANSHKVILNLLGSVVEARTQRGEGGSIYKVGKSEGEEDEPLVMAGAVTLVQSKHVAGAVAPGVLIGGTAWAFSRPDMEAALDYLFIDEAGQFSLANAVAVGTATANLVLVGDQMQLSQPTQGTHPGETGTSCLEYYLEDHATVPPDRGVFLGVSYRMHDGVCRFISHAIYEGRLTSGPDTGKHRVFGGTVARLPLETGIVWVPVEHEGCAQRSEDEVEVIAGLVDELRTRKVVDKDGGPRKLRMEDILVVAPYNMQVRALKARLPSGARVGSVDLFQGQEAPVVIVSLCSSTVGQSPRGASFLLSPNRLNVAVSRAEALAIVVGCPELMDVRCGSVEEMRLVNLLCHLVQYAEELGTA